MLLRASPGFIAEASEIVFPHPIGTIFMPPTRDSHKSATFLNVLAAIFELCVLIFTTAQRRNTTKTVMIRYHTSPHAKFDASLNISHI